MNIISEREAIEIAENSIKGKVMRQPGTVIEINLSANIYTITFVHSNQKKILSADYDAQIRVDAVTGKVVQFLVGP